MKYLEIPAREIVFARVDRGRPVVAEGQSTRQLEFSVSHSGAWVAIAIARRRLGVDLEIAEREVETDSLAAYFSHVDSRLQRRTPQEDVSALRRRSD